MIIPEEEKLWDSKKTAEYLGISRYTLYEWVIQRRIPHYKVGRLIKFRKANLDAWIEGKERKVEPINV